MHKRTNKIYRFFNPETVAEDEVIYLDTAESHHARNVLRLRQGEQVQVLNGKGLEVTGILEFKSGRNAQVKKLTVRYLDKPEKPCILGFAATDNRDSDALIIRSAVEMGVTEISVLISQYAGFKQSGDTNRFLERRHKIMVGACKQSGRLWLPEITGPMKLEDFLDSVSKSVQVFAGWEPGLGKSMPSFLPSQIQQKGFAWIVGPEGGWSSSDVSILDKKGVSLISLGSSTLTSPVAAIAGLAALKVIFDDWWPFYDEIRMK
ncbi:MAG: RsmE family RNA methyltransferase [bacterium]